MQARVQKISARHWVGSPWSSLATMPHSLSAANRQYPWMPGSWSENGTWEHGCWHIVWGHFSSGYEGVIGEKGRRPYFLRLLGLSHDAVVDLSSEALWGTPRANSARGTCKPDVVPIDYNQTIMNLYNQEQTWKNLSVMAKLLRKSNAQLRHSHGMKGQRFDLRVDPIKDV